MISPLRISGAWFPAVCALLCALAARGFELDARIYPADTVATLRFRATTEWDKKNFDTVKVGYVRDDRRFGDGKAMRYAPRRQMLKCRRENGALVVTVPLRGEHEHSFVFIAPPGKGEKEGEERYYSIYTLAPDAFKLRPFKGEFHQHSNVSDGSEPPQDSVRYAREAGLDFLAVTDHGSKIQNPVVAAAARDSGSGLVTYPGEEMHNAGAILHSVCLGAPDVMSMRKRTPELAAAVEPILAELRKELPQMHDSERRSIAEALYVARRARASGAVLIYCHPHWKPHGRYNAPPEFTRYMLTHDDFDAIEIANGQFNHDNYLTAALLYEIAAERGKRWPVVSASDCHRTKNVALLKRNYNLLFAPDCSFPEFKKGLRDHRLVAAVETMNMNKRTTHPIFFGAWRFVKLATFLERCGYWQNHDRLTAAQGSLIEKFLKGDKSVVPQIRELAAEIDRCRERLYCGDPAVVKPLEP
jgi:hypothetical protein